MTPELPKPRAPAQPWTPEQDVEVRRLRASGLTWLAIGKQIGRDGASCRIRITHYLGEPDPLLGAVVPRPRKANAPPPSAPSAVFLRSAMDAGDAVSWGAITEGTILAGCVYRTPSGMMGLLSRPVERGR